jgi:hypothetical protein
MHAITSAIAGSLRTSTAPTGSRLLPPPRSQNLVWILSRWKPRGGAQSSCGVTSSAAGQRGGYPTSSRSYWSLGRGDNCDLSGWQSSCRSTRWSTRNQLQGRQSSRGSTRWRPEMQRGLFVPLQVVRSSDDLDFQSIYLSTYL